MDLRQRGIREAGAGPSGEAQRLVGVHGPNGLPPAAGNARRLHGRVRPAARLVVGATTITPPACLMLVMRNLPERSKRLVWGWSSRSRSPREDGAEPSHEALEL